MLTLKLITEETERVIRGLEKKHFKGAKEAIDKVLAVDKQRREAQQQADKTKQFYMKRGRDRTVPPPFWVAWSDCHKIHGHSWTLHGHSC